MANGYEMSGKDKHTGAFIVQQMATGRLERLPISDWP